MPFARISEQFVPRNLVSGGACLVGTRGAISANDGFEVPSEDGTIQKASRASTWKQRLESGLDRRVSAKFA